MPAAAVQRSGDARRLRHVRRRRRADIDSGRYRTRTIGSCALRRCSRHTRRKRARPFLVLLRDADFVRRSVRLERITATSTRKLRFPRAAQRQMCVSINEPAHERASRSTPSSPAHSVTPMRLFAA